MTDETLGGADPAEAELPVIEPEPEELPTLGANDPPPKRTRSAAKPPPPPEPPLLEVGAHVWYVMPDGTDRDAVVLRVDGSELTLVVQVGLTPLEDIQRLQFARVPYGPAGAPQTWREQG